MASLEFTRSSSPVSGLTAGSSSNIGTPTNGSQQHDQSILRGASIVRSNILAEWVTDSDPLVAACRHVMADNSCVSANVVADNICALKRDLICTSSMDPLSSTVSPRGVITNGDPIRMLESKAEPQSSIVEEEESEATSWYLESNTHHTSHEVPKGLLDEEKEEDDNASQDLLPDAMFLHTLRQEALDWESFVSEGTPPGDDDTSEPLEDTSIACAPLAGSSLPTLSKESREAEASPRCSKVVAEQSVVKPGLLPSGCEAQSKEAFSMVCEPREGPSYPSDDSIAAVGVAIKSGLLLPTLCRSSPPEGLPELACSAEKKSGHLSPSPPAEIPNSTTIEAIALPSHSSKAVGQTAPNNPISLAPDLEAATSRLLIPSDPEGSLADMGSLLDDCSSMLSEQGSQPHGKQGASEISSPSSDTDPSKRPDAVRKEVRDSSSVERSSSSEGGSKARTVTTQDSGSAIYHCSESAGSQESSGLVVGGPEGMDTVPDDITCDTAFLTLEDGDGPSTLPLPLSPVSEEYVSRLQDDEAYSHARRAGYLWQSLAGQHVRFPRSWWDGSRAPIMGCSDFVPEKGGKGFRVPRFPWQYVARRRVTEYRMFAELVKNRASPGRLLLHINVINSVSMLPTLEIAVGCFHPNARGIRKGERADPAQEDAREVWTALRKRSAVDVGSSSIELHLCKGNKAEEIGQLSPLGPIHEVTNVNMRPVFGEEPPVHTIFIQEGDLLERLELSAELYPKSAEEPTLTLLEEFLSVGPQLDALLKTYDQLSLDLDERSTQSI